MKKRRVKRKVEQEGFGTDSFLDVVSNIVGILIILVMVVGVRAKDVMVVDAQPEAPDGRAGRRNRGTQAGPLADVRCPAQGPASRRASRDATDAHPRA